MKGIAHDKALHLSAGAWAALLGLLIGAALTNWAAGPRLDAASALAGCVLAGLGREAYNVALGGPWSWADVGATVVGGLPVVMSASVGDF